MSDVNPQAVAETDGQSKTVAEAESALDQDSILKQYETETAPETTPETSTTAPDLKAIEARMNEYDKRVMMDEYRKDISDFIKKVRGDLDPEMFSDKFVEAYLSIEADADKRIQRAWLNRKNDPKTIDKMAKNWNKSFTDKFTNLPDKQITSDTEAVVAAVRGASNKTPGQDKPVDLNKMSDRDFNKLQNSLIYGR